MEQAIATFGKLGAHIEDCRTQPLQRPNDVKIVIAETELFAIHHAELVKRPGDFGLDFLGRVLPACLFQSHDYLQASREHRRIIAATRPLYERYDVLLTCGSGSAPRLDAHRIINFWLRPQVFAPANLTGGPALVLPCGFSNGLPLGLQIIGRPFADDVVLRVGHAYQQATDWHLRRPQLVAGAPQPKLTAGEQSGTPNADAAMRNFVERTAARAGLRLNEQQMNVLLEAAPHAIAMTERLREPRDRSEEPSLVFRIGED
jgi:aspartyl-tRNA(Asn)/glutamyl-tRNA(Gln) amidotransferase subunit A